MPVACILLFEPELEFTNLPLFPPHLSVTMVLLANSLISLLPGKKEEKTIKLRRWMKRTRRRTQIDNLRWRKVVEKKHIIHLKNG